MQTEDIACLPGVAVEFAVTGIWELRSTDRNERLRLALAEPLSDPSLFCVKLGVAPAANFVRKSPLNTSVAVDTWFADACVTPVSTAASRDFCICDLMS